jgi:tetratricopeptide (TPR) repeat protein
MSALLLAALLALAAAPSPAPAPKAVPAAEQLRSAKALFFDGRYAEARAAWEQARPALKGADAQAALYWTARCSEKLGESERALKEYSAFLAARPADRALAEEARTSRVGLAARLHKAGRTQHAAILTEALADPSRTVRYYAALQLAGLGPGMAAPAVPVLKEIVATEKDEELVGRAKLALLRVDPGALTGLPPEDRTSSASSSSSSSSSSSASSSATSRRSAWIKVRITEKGRAEPKVSLTMPFALAELVFKSLPDESLRELRSKGYDAETFWRRLRDMGPTDVIDIEGDEGERIRIWTE